MRVRIAGSDTMFVGVGTVNAYVDFSHLTGNVVHVSDVKTVDLIPTLRALTAAANDHELPEPELTSQPSPQPLITEENAWPECGPLNTIISIVATNATNGPGVDPLVDLGADL
jgi:hypothetical protein